MLSAEALEYAARAIIQQMAGNILKVNEYCGYVNKAIEIHREEPKEVKCRYKKNGQWIPAKVDFSSGRVIDLSGNILWEGKRLCC